MSDSQRRGLTLGIIVGALGNGVFYAVAAAGYLLLSGRGTLEGLIVSWIGGFCAAALLVGLPFIVINRNRGQLRGAIVGWVIGLALVQACAICGGVGLGLSGLIQLPG